jgi:hypothetical protein
MAAAGDAIVVREEPLLTYAVLHTCPNQNCSGAVVGYYIGPPGRPHKAKYNAHEPQWKSSVVPNEVPERARILLQQANYVRNLPVACETMALRSIEAMLTEMGLNKRGHSLKKRFQLWLTTGYYLSR